MCAAHLHVSIPEGISGQESYEHVGRRNFRDCEQMPRSQGHYLIIQVLSITFQSWEQDFERAIAKENSHYWFYCTFPLEKYLNTNYEIWYWALVVRETERRGKWTRLFRGRDSSQFVRDPPPLPVPACYSMGTWGWSQQGPNLRVQMMVTIATETAPSIHLPTGWLMWLLMLMRLRSNLVMDTSPRLGEPPPCNQRARTLWPSQTSWPSFICRLLW